MIEPKNFGYNELTSESNLFQKLANYQDSVVTHKKALKEFLAVVDGLKGIGVSVLVLEEDKLYKKPDAIFPNNWISTHEDGRVLIYPMLATNRRFEKRKNIFEELSNHFKISDYQDLSFNEKNNQFLEGTGSMVLDRQNKVAYANLSERTDKDLFFEVCQMLDFEPVYFEATDKNGKPIYHTNVTMMIGSGYAVVCLEAIKTGKEAVIKSLKRDGIEIIEISLEQMHSFCGNLLEVTNNLGNKFVCMSYRARAAFNPNQLNIIEKFANIQIFNIPTIEQVGGGGIRCMMAEIFLPSK